jgi:hypothetical protein
MRLLAIAAVAAACGGPQRAQISGRDRSANLTTGATLASDQDDEPPPSYSKQVLEQALVAERGAEAADEQRVAATPDDYVLARDLAVRRRFIATLESCQASNHACPPRLDDPKWTWDPTAPATDTTKPPIDSPLRFDLDDWRKIADELHGRACACRTLRCVDSMEVTIQLLEARPMQDVESDAAASASITGARECLFQLRDGVH